MDSANSRIPTLTDPCPPTGQHGGLRTLDELETRSVAAPQASFNTCTRASRDRRRCPDRRRRPRADSEERRSGRDRRMMTYF